MVQRDVLTELCQGATERPGKVVGLRHEHHAHKPRRADSPRGESICVPRSRPLAFGRAAVLDIDIQRIIEGGMRINLSNRRHLDGVKLEALDRVFTRRVRSMTAIVCLTGAAT